MVGPEEWHQDDKIQNRCQLARLPGAEFLNQVQKIPNLAYQIYQTLQIYSVYEKDYIKYKCDRK